LAMLALRLYGPGDARLEEVEEPRVPDGWVLVRSLMVGVCGTDKAFYRGTYPLFKRPLIPGHEVVGEVVEAPHGWEHLLGRLVVPEINFPCWRCWYCRRGLYTHCPRRRTLGIDFDGGMAEYFVAPADSLHVVEGLSPEEAVHVEPLAAVVNAFRQYPPPVGEEVAVIGTGSLAYLAVQVLRLLGASPVVVARSDSPKAGYFLRLGVEVMGFDEALRRAERLHGGFPMVFEASGSTRGLREAVELVRPRGVIHLKSTPGGEASFNSTLLVVKEARIYGTRCGTGDDFEAAIRMLRRGAVKPLVTARMKLLDGEEVFKRALKREELKVVVKVPE